MKTRTEPLKAFRPGRAALHPYEEWFTAAEKSENGVNLFIGEDFDSAVPTMRHNLYRTAKKRGVKVRTITILDNKGNETGLGLKVLRVEDTVTDTKTEKQ